MSNTSELLANIDINKTAEKLSQRLERLEVLLTKNDPTS